jgi:hypothetical protein
VVRPTRPEDVALGVRGDHPAERGRHLPDLRQPLHLDQQRRQPDRVQVDAGYYTVTFPGYTTLGNVQVSSWTTAKDKCRLLDTYVNGAGLHAGVVCAPLAHPAKYVDTPFMIQMVTTS